MFEIKDFKPRLYQENIVHTSLTKNTLVVLPTGLGKTKIAILLGVYRLNNFLNSSILICSPTKPLSSQIHKEFIESTNIPEEKICLLTGLISPQKRKKLLENSLVIIATPQTIQSDLENSRISLENFSMLCIDEAHRSGPNFANTKVAKIYNEQSKFPRILALTASPGSTKDKINDICNNLFIESVQIKTEEDEDVKDYIQKKKINWVIVELSEEYREIINLVSSVYKDKLKSLKSYGIFKPVNLINKKDLLLSQRDFQRKIKEGDKMAYSGISLVAQLLKLNYALELLETQGVISFKQFIEKLQNETSKASLSIKNNQNIVKAYNLTNKTELIHPKLKKLIGIITEKFYSDKSSKVIIFSKYRSTVKHIVEELNKIDNIKSVELLGQKEGITQKKQIETIRNFEEGVYNVMVTSNIGEEGISIKGSSLCIFFDQVYGIRRIQRAGRVARTMPGEIIYLITKGTMDEGMYWKSKQDISKMTYNLKKIQDKNNQQTKLV